MKLLARVLGALLLLGLVILIIKWALITAAILAVPFGTWWVWDHRSQRTAGKPAAGPPTDARRGAPSAAPGMPRVARPGYGDAGTADVDGPTVRTTPAVPRGPRRHAR